MFFRFIAFSIIAKINTPAITCRIIPIPPLNDTPPSTHAEITVSSNPCPITGWPDGTATTAARVCLHAWLAERGGAGNFEGDAILARLRQVIERFGESRFTRWESAAAKIDEHGPRTIDRLGFRKTMEHGMGDALHTTNTYYVLPEAWRSEIFRGMNLSAVNKELLRRGVLEPGKDGKASTAVRLPGLGLQRCYVVIAVPEQGDHGAQAA